MREIIYGHGRAAMLRQVIGPSLELYGSTLSEQLACAQAHEPDRGGQCNSYLSVCLPVSVRKCKLYKFLTLVLCSMQHALPLTVAIHS